jgi:hypothetical protein
MYLRVLLVHAMLDYAIYLQVRQNNKSMRVSCQERAQAVKCDTITCSIRLRNILARQLE